AASSGNGDSDGGGVYVLSGSAFTMNGGAISGNTASNGGGVAVNSDRYTSGTFTMRGGTVYGSGAGGGLANTAPYGASLYNSGTATYGNGSNIIASGNATDATLAGHN
ncbi:MAG: hypothetical protein LBS82_03305, partial [Spirochaetaceae bacterium]|nr:hypothetical protein [Spirochaetaceae bacterium]